VSWFRNKFSISNAAFGLFDGFGTDEGFSIFVPVFKEPGDGAFQFGHPIKATPADGLPG
jgi:hypothetical protein